MQSKPKKHSKQSLFMESTPKLGLYRWGTVSLSIHKYKYTNTNAQIQIHKYSQMWLWKRSVRSAWAQKAYQSWPQQNVPSQRPAQIEGSLSPKRVFEILDLYHGSLYPLLMHYFPSNLRKPEQAVADHMPFITVSDKAFLQMVPKRPYAYCVHVNVYSSKFEHNLKYYFEGLI